MDTLRYLNGMNLYVRGGIVARGTKKKRQNMIAIKYDFIIRV